MSQNQSIRGTNFLLVLFVYLQLSSCKNINHASEEVNVSDTSISHFLNVNLNKPEDQLNESEYLSSFNQLNGEEAYVLSDTVYQKEFYWNVKKEIYGSSLDYIIDNSNESTKFICIDSSGHFNTHPVILKRELKNNMIRHEERAIEDIQVGQPYKSRVWSYVVILDVRALHSKTGLDNLSLLMRLFNSNFIEARDYLSLVLYNEVSKSLDSNKKGKILNKSSGRIVDCITNNEATLCPRGHVVLADTTQDFEE